MGKKRGPYKGRGEYGKTTAAGYGSDWRRLRLVILERDGYRCHYCPNRATTVDHVIPKARGGSDDPSNLVAACGGCNFSKQHRGAPRRNRPRAPRTILEWQPTRPGPRTVTSRDW